MMTGLSAMFGIVALLDGRVERVAIDMGQRQRGQRGVTNEARRAAFAAAPGRDVEIAEAIPAKAGRPVQLRRGGAHGTSRSERSCVQRLARGGDGGRIELRGGRERLHGCVIAHDEIEHAGEKMRVGGGRAQRLRADPAFGQEQAETLGVAGDEGKRLNRNDFSYFAGVVSSALSTADICLSVTYGLYFGTIMPESAERVQASGNR